MELKPQIEQCLPAGVADCPFDIFRCLLPACPFTIFYNELPTTNFCFCVLLCSAMDYGLSTADFLLQAQEAISYILA
jgi:hypothetical protein